MSFQATAVALRAGRTATTRAARTSSTSRSAPSLPLPMPTLSRTSVNATSIRREFMSSSSSLQPNYYYKNGHLPHVLSRRCCISRDLHSALLIPSDSMLLGASLRRPSIFRIQANNFSKTKERRRHRKKRKKTNIKNRNTNKQKKNNNKKDDSTKKKVLNPNKLLGPHGRPVMTEQRFFKDDNDNDNDNDTSISRQLGLGFHNNNPKEILHNAKQRGLQFEIIMTHDNHSDSMDPPMYVATMTCSFREEDLLPFLSQRHPHIVSSIVDEANGDGDNDDATATTTTTTMNMVCMGVAGTKKKAETLAAADACALLNEIGIDAKNPPNARKKARDEANMKAAEAEAFKQAKQKETYKQDLSRAQMILEVLNTSRPSFEVSQTGPPTKARGNKQWIATASIMVRGDAYQVEGLPSSRKVEAEGNAVIALANEPNIQQLVGPQIMKLIDDAPGNQVASLRIPALPHELTDTLEQILGGVEEHDNRAHAYELVKIDYEEAQRERETKYEDREYQATNKYNKQQSMKYGDKELVNTTLKREEEDRRQKAVDNPNGKHGSMKEVRDALPIKRIEEELIEALNTEQVIVISGGTGSGKSTQVPQYILENALVNGNGADTQILVTQPRKIAAISVAERVAAERCEAIGDSVGYTVRFKRQSPRECGGSVEFVTTGLLLRRIVNDPSLVGVSHVLIDEVHERDINTDFLLVLIRKLLKERPDLRVILMSATLDAESFSEYFSRGGEASKVPLLSVPTQPRHPVDVFYLEDLIGTGAGAFPMETSKLAASLLQFNDQQLKADLEEAIEEEEAAAALLARSRSEDQGDALESDSDSDDESFDQISAIAEAKERLDIFKRTLSERKADGVHELGKLRDTLDRKKFDQKAAIVELAASAIQHLCGEEIAAERSGSILCFLPGWDEIGAATKILENAPSPLKEMMTILPLHSTIPQQDQQKVFEPANGKIKVILATNIAESSVTIDDVLVVVDSGLVRELNYDSESNMTAMETNKTSRASATQRLGRAGRVAPGKCFRLYSRGDFETMQPRATPEIQRTALESTCIQTCSMTTSGVERFLGQALDPPSADSVSIAMERLVKLGAIDTENGSEVLTPLGRCVSRLPVDPATGKMLLMGVLMKCLDPILTSAACISSRNIFYSPPKMRKEAQAIRRSFSETSDMLANTRAYDEFWSIVDEEGWTRAKEWAWERYINVAAMVSMRAVRGQLLSELNRMGVIPNSDLARIGRSRNHTLRKDAYVNQCADNEALYTAVWATAFPGNLAARRQLGSFGTLRTRMDDHAGIHPSSVGFYRKPPQGKRLPSWYLYQQMVLSSQVFLRSSAAMETEQILLFGGYNLRSLNSNTDTEETSSRVRGVVDDWIFVDGRCSKTVDLLCMVRKDINLALKQKAMFPRRQLPRETQDILDTVGYILADDNNYDD